MYGYTDFVSLVKDPNTEIIWNKLYFFYTHLIMVFWTAAQQVKIPVINTEFTITYQPLCFFFNVYRTENNIRELVLKG